MGECIILNRKKQKISILTKINYKNIGLVILMHGLGGNKKIPILESISKNFENAGYSTIRFDTTDSFGDSDGNFENALIKNYYEDLEDVINWTKYKSFFKDKIILVGHSLGGLCTTLFAAKNQSLIKSLIPISTTISGKLSLECYPKELLLDWEKNGFLEWKDRGQEKKLKWEFMEDAQKYDILEHAESLKIPTLIISAENDFEAPPKHHELLYEKLQGKKQLTIIKNGTHHLDTDENIKDVQKTIEDWISKL